MHAFASDVSVQKIETMGAAYRTAQLLTAASLAAITIGATVTLLR